MLHLESVNVKGEGGGGGVYGFWWWGKPKWGGLGINREGKKLGGH